MISYHAKCVEQRRNALDYQVALRQDGKFHEVFRREDGHKRISVECEKVRYDRHAVLLQTV